MDFYLNYFTHEVCGLPLGLQVGHFQEPANVIGVIRHLMEGEEVGQQSLHNMADLGGVTPSSERWGRIQ